MLFGKSMPSSPLRVRLVSETMSPANRMKSKGSPITLRWWAFLVLAALILLLVIPLSSPIDGNLFGENLLNLLHVPLFALVTFLLRFLQLSTQFRWRSLGFCILAALALAAISEMAQVLTGRTPSVGDLGADLGGILLASMVLLPGSGRRAVIVRYFLLLAGSGMLALAVRPLVEELVASRAKQKVFPTLLDLSQHSGLWQAQGATRLKVLAQDSGAEGRGLEVQMASGSYEGLRYLVPEAVDAVGYSELALETANPGEAFELGVRMDGGGQRQYGSVMVPPGRSILHAEWTSNIHVADPIRVVLFTGENQPARTFQLLDARLDREIPRTIPAGP
jgi:VanZ family protein